jgi:hypothetical protein
MKSIPCKNSKKIVSPIGQLKAKSQSRMNSIPRKSDSFLKTLRSINNYASPTRVFLQKDNTPDKKAQKLIPKFPNIEQNDGKIDSQMKSYFKCIDVFSLEDLTINHQLVNEFFHKEFFTSNASLPRKLFDEISESFEMVELNNQSIHLSKLFNYANVNSPENSQIKLNCSPRNEDVNTRAGSRDKSRSEGLLPQKIRKLREAIRMSGLAIESKNSCYFHLEKINQIIAQDKSLNNDLSFSRHLQNPKALVQKRGKPHHFKFI